MNNQKNNQKITQLKELKITDVITTNNNPRIINEKGAAFSELLESIRAQGVIVPIHVRFHPKQLGKYELLAGERRLLASVKADKTTIPAIDHGSINDEEAFEITFAENFGREDLTPLEQSKAVVILLSKYRNDVNAVASKMNKSVRWVLQRAAISKNLSEKWQKALLDYPALSKWTSSHLGMIAALPKEVQDDIIINDQEFDDWSYEEIPTTAELEKFINNKLMLLSKAPWDINDKGLVKKVPACSKCPKRSSHQPGLFDDTTDKDTVQKNDRCLDERCWDQKMAAFVEMKASELRAKHKNLVFAIMPGQKVGHYEGRELSERFGNIACAWTDSKEGAKDALPALIVFGKNAGDFRWIKLTKSISGSSRGGGMKTKDKPTPLKERRELLGKKRWFVVIRKVMEELEEKKIDELVTDDRIKTVMALTLDYGTSGEYGSVCDWKELVKLSADQVAVNLWEDVQGSIHGALTYCGPITQTPDKLIEEAKDIAALVGLNIDEIFKKVSEEDYPEPKSWKSLNADGTPKKNKSGKKKTAKNKKQKSKEWKNVKSWPCMADERLSYMDRACTGAR